MSESKHSPLPWMPSPLGFAMNDGAVPVMSVGDPDGDRVRVALVDCHTKYKRGEGHKVKCPIRDANLALILRAVNSHADMIAALRHARSTLVSALECGLGFPKAEKAEIIANHVTIKAIDAALAKATGGKS
jgi:hypothetical protein